MVMLPQPRCTRSSSNKSWQRQQQISAARSISEHLTAEHLTADDIRPDQTRSERAWRQGCPRAPRVAVAGRVRSCTGAVGPLCNAGHAVLHACGGPGTSCRGGQGSAVAATLWQQPWAKSVLAESLAPPIRSPLAMLVGWAHLTRCARSGAGKNRTEDTTILGEFQVKRLWPP